jgi:putative endonuclease
MTSGLRNRIQTKPRINQCPFAWVYIVSNKNNTTLYVGVTNDLPTRLWEHRTKRNPDSFTARYNLNKLVYYESFQWIEEVIKREKYIKGKVRKWKNELIATKNPEWLDLTDEVSLKP